jgi:hypothetical protein
VPELRRVPAAVSDPELSPADRAILDAYADWPPRGTLAQRIAELGISPVRYFQRLNALLDEPAAMVYAPELVNRLWRLRQLRFGASWRGRRERR